MYVQTIVERKQSTCCRRSHAFVDTSPKHRTEMKFDGQVQPNNLDKGKICAVHEVIQRGGFSQPQEEEVLQVPLYQVRKYVLPQTELIRKTGRGGDLAGGRGRGVALDPAPGLQRHPATI